MIPLNKIPPPDELTETRRKELTDLYIQTDQPVWKEPYIIKKLMLMSSSKCCYCECYLGEECKYMEIEHFYYKNKYKDKVVEWENLLPSCKRCNLHKKILDVEETPIVHPVFMIPKEHLYMKAYRLKERTYIGKNTWKEIKLNDTDRLAKKRFEIGQKISDWIERLYDDVSVKNIDIKYLRKVRRELESMLRECLPDKEYSATAATILVQESHHYDEIKRVLQENALWDKEFDELESTAMDIALVE